MIYLVVFLTTGLPVVLFLGTIIGVPAWAILRIKRQTTVKQRALTVLIGVIAIPLLLIVGEMISVGVLMGLHAVLVDDGPTGEIQEETSSQQVEASSNSADAA